MSFPTPSSTSSKDRGTIVPAISGDGSAKPAVSSRWRVDFIQPLQNEALQYLDRFDNYSCVCRSWYAAGLARYTKIAREMAASPQLKFLLPRSSASAAAAVAAVSRQCEARGVTHPKSLENAVLDREFLSFIEEVARDNHFFDQETPEQHQNLVQMLASKTETIASKARWFRNWLENFLENGGECDDFEIELKRTYSMIPREIRYLKTIHLIKWDCKRECSDISALRDLADLSVIILRGHKICDFSLFEAFKNSLVHLNLSNNSISDSVLQDLPSLENLFRLEINQNPIADISVLPIERMPNLGDLIISVSQIRDIKSLEKFKEHAPGLILHVEKDVFQTLSFYEDLKALFPSVQYIQ